MDRREFGRRVVAVTIGVGLASSASTGTVGAQPSQCACPDGADRTKYEVEDGAFVLEEGEDVITFTDVKYDEDGEIASFSFTSDRVVEQVCVKGGPDTETYSDVSEGDTLTAPTNPGGQQAAVSNVVFCTVEADEIRYFQVDLVKGEVIENLTKEDRYRSRKLSSGIVRSDSSKINGGPAGQKTVDGCTFEWTKFVFDPATQTVTVDVTLIENANEGEESCEATLAGYELPEGDTAFDIDNIEGQVLVDYQTMVPGETTRFEINLDE